MSTATLVKPSVGDELEIEIVPDLSRTTLARARGVTILSSFKVPYGREEVWTEIWQALQQSALSKSECQDFRILRDRKDLTHFLVLSEWKDAASFHRFVREKSLLWLERVMPGLYLPPEVTVLDGITRGQWPGERWEDDHGGGKPLHLTCWPEDGE